MLSRVLLDYPPPPYADTYDRIFQCPILFRQPGCSYEHVREDRTVELADPRTHAMAREMCEQLLDEINRTGGIAADIRRILIEQPGCYPSIEMIAEKLEMYPRALRRKLEAEGTSYRDLLAEVRMRLAIEYLRKTQMTNEEIAGRLGYSDAANFRHAFIRARRDRCDHGVTADQLHIVRNSLQVWRDRTFPIERGGIRCISVQCIPPPNWTAGAAGGRSFGKAGVGVHCVAREFDRACHHVDVAAQRMIASLTTLSENHPKIGLIEPSKPENLSIASS